MIFVSHENRFRVKRSQRGDDHGPSVLWNGTRDPDGAVKLIPGLHKGSGHGTRSARRDSREHLELRGRSGGNTKNQ